MRLEPVADLGVGHLTGRALRVADDGRTLGADLQRVMQHLLQLLGARRGEHRHARHLGEQGHVVHAVVARPVVAGDPGAVDAEHDRQPVHRHVVHDLVPRPVHEGGVDGHDRAHAAHRHARRRRDGVLLGDADVEEAVGEAGLERQQTGRPRHRRGDRHDAPVGLGFLDDGLGERLRVPGGHPVRRADGGVEDRRVVQVLLVVVLGRRVAATLLGEHVEHARPLELDGVAQRLFQPGDVVAVDRALVAHAERLEEGDRLERLAHGSLHRFHALLGVVTDHRQLAQHLLEPALAAHVHRVEPDLGEALAEVRHRGRVAAAVVVEDDDHAPLRVPEVVQRLVGHAPRHRPVADHRDDVAVRVEPRIAGDGEAVGVRQDRGRVAVLDEVVPALFAARVAGQPAGLT